MFYNVTEERRVYYFRSESNTVRVDEYSIGVWRKGSFESRTTNCFRKDNRYDVSPRKFGRRGDPELAPRI